MSLLIIDTEPQDAQVWTVFVLYDSWTRQEKDSLHI